MAQKKAIFTRCAVPSFSTIFKLVLRLVFFSSARYLLQLNDTENETKINEMMAITGTEMQIQFIRMHNPISIALTPLDTHFISNIFRLNYTFLRTRRIQFIFIFIFNSEIPLHELTERHSFFLFNLTKIFISIFSAEIT